MAYARKYMCTCTRVLAPHQQGWFSEVILMPTVTECVWEWNSLRGVLLETENYLQVSSAISKTRGSTDIKTFGQGVTHLSMKIIGSRTNNKALNKEQEGGSKRR